MILIFLDVYSNIFLRTRIKNENQVAINITKIMYLMLICFNDYLEIVVSYMLLAIFATMEKMFIEVARKTICEILTAAASALVGHLHDEDSFFQYLKLNSIRCQTRIIQILLINIFEWIRKIIYSTYVVISLIQR